VIWSDYISDDYSTAVMTGRKTMKIMWNIEKVTRSAQKTLRGVIIAALKWTPLEIAFTGRDKTKLGKV
jgi:hypothetical protein